MERSRVTVSFGETKVNTVNKVPIPSPGVRNKVCRLNVTMDQMPRVHEFDTFQHLIGYHKNRLEREPTSTLVELIFQGRSQQVHYHEIVRILCAEIMHLGKARSILQFTINLVLVTKLRTPGAVLFELYSDL